MVLREVKKNCASRSYLEFKSSNGRSKPLSIIFILKYPWRSNFIFFWIFLIFFRWVQNRLFWMVQKSLDQQTLYPSKKYKKNSKKYIIWSPRIFQYEDDVQRFGSTVWTFKFEIRTQSTNFFCFAKHHSITLYIYIYIYIYIDTHTHTHTHNYFGPDGRV